MQGIPFQDLTYRIIGAAMRVHNELGPRLKEAHYHRALDAALVKDGLTVESEKAIQIEIDGAFIGLLYIDHFVEDAVVVETKALPHLLTAEETAQVLTYLAVTQARVALLLNFGRNRLEYKRILPPEKVFDWRTRVRRYAWRPAESKTDDPAAEPIRLSVSNPLTTGGPY